MSTKKLQIVTPIVTSVDGKTGDVTLDGKISKAGDTFTGTLTFSNTSISSVSAIDLGKNGYIDNAQIIYFYYNKNGKDRGFYIETAPPATDDYYASAQFGGIEDDELVRLHGIAPPANDDDAANRAYVDEKVKYLTTDLYGTTLPTTATAGQIFFKKL